MDFQIGGAVDVLCTDLNERLTLKRAGFQLMNLITGMYVDSDSALEAINHTSGRRIKV